MSTFVKFNLAAAAILLAANCVAAVTPVHARGPGTHVNDAKYYGPVYGWRYSPPPATVPEPACSWTKVRVMRDGRAITRSVRRCS